MSGTIDLSLLPAPKVVQTLDFETILARLRADLLVLAPTLADVLALESEPINKLLQVAAYREITIRARINDAARSCMLAYATGSNLDHLAAFYAVARLDGETDDRLRTRAQMAPEGMTVAGSRGAYQFHALSASAEVADVTVDNPTPGTVRLTLLSTTGTGAASEELQDEVLAYLSSDTRRPLSDTVVVQSATIVNYAVTASLNVYPGPAPAPILAAAQAAVAAYVVAQARLGYDITLSGLYAALHQPGVQRVVLTEPAEDIVITETQAAHCTATAITLGVVDV